MTDILTDGIFRTKDHVYYDHGVGPLTSVTTATKMFDKSDVLLGWAKKVTAETAVNHLDLLVTHRTHNSPDPYCPPCMAYKYRPFSSREAGRRWLSSLPDTVRDAAADLGTRVHAVAESMGRGEHFAAEQDPTVIPFAAQYLRWQEDYAPTYHAIEYLGVNRTHGYAGTGDIIATLGTGYTGPWCIDIKTHTNADKPLPKDYYPETGMQLAACSRLEFVSRQKGEDVGDECLIARDVVPARDVFPAPTNFAVLLLGREDYRFIPYAVTDETFEAFLACLRLNRWKYGEGKTIVGRAA